MTTAQQHHHWQLDNHPPYPITLSPALKQIKQKLHCWIHKDYTIDGPDLDWTIAIPNTPLGNIAPVPNPSNSQSINDTDDPVQCDIDSIDPYDWLV